MRAAVGTEEERTAALAEADMRASAGGPVQAELVVATAELGLAVLLAAMARGITRRESQQDDMAATAAMAATGKGPTNHECRLEAKRIILAQGRKAGPLPNSLRVRQITPIATTFPEIDPKLVLRADPASSNAPARRRELQPSLAALGHGRM
jgi:hypothetical protein